MRDRESTSPLALPLRFRSFIPAASSSLSSFHRKACFSDNAIDTTHTIRPSSTVLYSSPIASSSYQSSDSRNRSYTQRRLWLKTAGHLTVKRKAQHKYLNDSVREELGADGLELLENANGLLISYELTCIAKPQVCLFHSQCVPISLWQYLSLLVSIIVSVINTLNLTNSL
ncbi:unnamed protein product [Periconia digitata]|uniref:Uncharacterized protein n=1 Tax=Periconia digitata TaxID=1303443 RepID=A0A9W4XVL5_9PLEO|nr:unnamed protein product [Periconia digitata]